MAGSRSMLRLESPQLIHEERFIAAVQGSQQLHGNWVSPPSTPEAYRAWLAKGQTPTVVSHLLVNQAGELLGVINLNEIVRGCFQSAYLGYYAFAPHQRQGNLRKGLQLVLQRAFGQYALHRVEANIIPGNEASQRLVRSLGFRLEGLSPDYLKIAGRWQDHERWALTADLTANLTASLTASPPASQPTCREKMR